MAITLNSSTGSITLASRGIQGDQGTQGDQGIQGDVGPTGPTGPEASTDQRIVNTASPTAILTADGNIMFDSTSTAISIDLPSASVGKVKVPYKDIGVNSSNNNITINRVGSDTIVDTAAAQTSTIIAIDGHSGFFLSDGVDTWYLM